MKSKTLVIIQWFCYLFIFFLGLFIGAINGYNLKEIPHCNACLPCEDCDAWVENETVMKYTFVWEKPTLESCNTLYADTLLAGKQIKTSAEVWSK